MQNLIFVWQTTERAKLCGFLQRLFDLPVHGFSTSKVVLIKLSTNLKSNRYTFTHVVQKKRKERDYYIFKAMLALTVATAIVTTDQMKAHHDDDGIEIGCSSVVEKERTIQNR